LSQGTPSLFEEAAIELLPYFSAVSHIALSPQGEVRYVYPRAGNEKSIGFNPLNDPLQRDEARRAVDSGQLTLAAPVDLVQGGKGAVARLPIFLEDQAGRQFWGFSSVIISIDKLLEQANFHQLDTSVMAYEMWSDNAATGTRLMIVMNDSGRQRDPVVKTIHVPNGTWTLSIEPVNGWKIGRAHV